MLPSTTVQESHPGGKLSTHVLSLGRPLYIQTAWQILDERGLIIPRHNMKHKVRGGESIASWAVPLS